MTSSPLVSGTGVDQAQFEGGGGGGYVLPKWGSTSGWGGGVQFRLVHLGVVLVVHLGGVGVQF